MHGWGNVVSRFEGKKKTLCKKFQSYSMKGYNRKHLVPVQVILPAGYCFLAFKWKLGNLFFLYNKLLMDNTKVGGKRIVERFYSLCHKISNARQFGIFLCISFTCGFIRLYKKNEKKRITSCRHFSVTNDWLFLCFFLNFVLGD